VSPLELKNYINLVKEAYTRRKLIQFGKEILNSGYMKSENIEKIFQKIEDKFYVFQEQTISKNFYTSSELIQEVYRDIKLKLNEPEEIGFQSSFEDLDSILQGFQKSDLIIIAGRPSMGKTAFSLNLGKNIVEKYKIPLLIFSLEMSRQQIIYRFLSSESNIYSNRIKAGKMTLEEWKKLTLAMKTISELPIYIDDNSNISISEIKTKLKNIFLGKDKKEAIIIIDYLQLMKIASKSETRSQEISTITRNLKILAKEFQIPIFLLSQLSRNLESRINKRPILSDLRESGCVGKNDQTFVKNSEKKFLSWNKSFSYYFEKKIEKKFKGLKPAFTIFLENNLKLIFTSNHKILCKNSWIPISELTIKNKILTFSESNKNKNCISISYLAIKQINYENIISVYDQNIPLFHNYCEKNILVHNSIEQDADIVIMIFRDDSSKTKNENNLLLTEFIIAKHRNGPTGIAKLIFNAGTTTFQNI
jgi:replicative DNA helicase